MAAEASCGSFFSPSELKSIHGRLFKGLLKEAGVYRRYNITKNEWVLKGDTVRYSSWNIIPETLEYDFEKEGAFSYQGLSKLEVTRHIAAFVSGIWQIHPFCEGNTRTTAVFIIKYLNAMGLEIGNEPFADHSWYFRNALVRANYTNLDQDVHETSQFLEAFFENALLDASHDLKNRYLHIDWAGEVNATGDGETHTPQVTPQVDPPSRPPSVQAAQCSRRQGAFVARDRRGPGAFRSQERHEKLRGSCARQRTGGANRPR